MFPQNWYQVWASPPAIGIAHTPAVLCWFQMDGDFPNTIPAFAELSLQTTTWLTNTIWSFPVVPEPGFTFTANCYINGSFGNIQFGLSLISPPVSDHYEPLQKVAVIQRLTTSLNRTGRGRCYLPVYDVGFVKNNHLTSTGLTVYQNIADNMTVPFMAGGVNFFPALVSYVDGTITTLNRCIAVPRLGVWRRKAKVRKGSFPLTPKTPPP